MLDPETAARLGSGPLPFSAAPAIALQVLAPAPGAAAVPVALGAVPWRAGGRLRLTVVCKASFTIGQGPRMVPAAAAEPFRSSDAHHKNQPLSHVVAASDRVPWKGSVDVTVLGQARAPGGAPVPEVRARIGVHQGGKLVLDKMVRVVGDRAGKDAAPRPFTALPIVYTRAVGGLGAPDNPVGCSPDDDEHPNILDLRDPSRPAGFGPIAAAWAPRSRRLGDLPRKALDAPILDLPPGFDWGYFQSAPPDQLLPELYPDATLLLAGFSAERPEQAIALPGAAAAGAIYGLDDASPDRPAPLAFRADTLHVDLDLGLAVIVYRACVDLRDPEQLGRLLVAAGVGPAGAPPPIPATRPSAGAMAASAAPDPLYAASTGTVALGAGMAPVAVTLPFGKQAAIDETLAFPTAEPAAPPIAPAAAAPPMPFAAPAPPVFLPDPGAVAAPLPVAPAAPGPAPRASSFFHDPAKLRALGEPTPAAPAAPAPEAPKADEIDLARYAQVLAALTRPEAELAAVLDAEGIAPAAWKKAEAEHKRALAEEARRGKQALRDVFDEAFVERWEKVHPDRFRLWHYACLKHAESTGQLHNELADQGLDAALGMRLRRVFRRRIAADRALAEELDRVLAVVRER